MTFDQLTTVRHDGIVDESIVFRALWQRVALRRLFFPESHPASQAEDEPYELAEQRAALNDYFDVDDSDEKEQRRKILLGSPKYRFCTSIRVPRPCLENGWSREEAIFPSQVIDELTGQQLSPPNPKSLTDAIWTKTIYSKPKSVLGSTYRIQIEAKAIPGAVLQLDDDDIDREDMLVCQFELERIIPAINRNATHNTKSKIPTKAKVKYSVYCLNRFQRLTEDRQVDAEDRALIPVSECVETDDDGNAWKGYQSKVKIDTDCKHDLVLDVVAVLKVQGLREQ
ncbi:hypothetical protein BX666DRAFT_1859444 [Dichotomocladium elegans]|nr:hypothetical protein BX666DRAFT_1859444 [Dichotomocladium elegans]